MQYFTFIGKAHYVEADYFFDGFVVDWVVQDRINNAKRQVEEAIRRTESIVNQLQRM